MVLNNKYKVDSVRDLATAKKRISEYAMAFDLLAKITQSGTEKETVESILQAFNILFSPQKLLYVSLKEGKPEHVYALSILNEDAEAIKSRLTNFSQKYAWTASNNGFQVKISHNANDFGLLEVDELIFPEHKEHYLNLTLSITDVCGLAIENALIFQRIKENESEIRQEKDKLEKALSDIKLLSGLVPICLYCKNIRDDAGYWNRVESYIALQPEADLSHGICPACAEKYHPDEGLYEEEN